MVQLGPRRTAREPQVAGLVKIWQVAPIFLMVLNYNRDFQKSFTLQKIEIPGSPTPFHEGNTPAVSVMILISCRAGHVYSLTLRVLSPPGAEALTFLENICSEIMPL